ncbi:serine/threonine-protein kinase, partial [Aldersonia kunmingensis]|uniref:serine/threonine-protein kinase n=1 Tax=Aldersonia kunmingensis TaxID=408066 RepID=UPI000ADCF437
MNDEQSPTPPAGSQVGNYHLQELLGSGRLGEVHSAGNAVTRELVAVKLMARELCADAAYGEQFRRANALAARLPEPHAVPIRDWGEIGGQLYVEMELVDGHDLRRLLTTQGPLTAEHAVSAVEQIATVLHAAHASGLVHGDVKPENLLLTRSGFWQLGDFGLLPDGSGAVSGTPNYPPPERANGFPPSPSGDVYALACLLRECLSGTQLTSGDPGDLGGFDEVIARGTAAHPNERYGTATAFAQAARAVLTRSDGATQVVAASPAPVVEPEPTVEPEPFPEQAWSEAPAPHEAGWGQSRADVAWSDARHEPAWSDAPAEGVWPP